MYYLIFRKKLKGQRGPYPVTKMIEMYTKSYGENDICICSPGFMSKTNNTIDKFAKVLVISDNLYFAEGMNGTKKLLIIMNTQYKN